MLFSDNNFDTFVRTISEADIVMDQNQEKVIQSKDFYKCYYVNDYGLVEWSILGLGNGDVVAPFQREKQPHHLCSSS